MLEKVLRVQMLVCSEIFERIERAYAKRQGKGELWYYADMTKVLRHAVP